MTRNQDSINRRVFLKTGISGMAGISLLNQLPGSPRLAPEETKAKFIFRTLGKTGIKLPIVSMGVMNADNPNLVKAALDAGMVMLDTAHGYQRGRNEEMLGQVIKDRSRDSYIIATKVVGTPMDRQTGLFTAETKGEALLEKFDISLQRLGLDHVDIFYLHNITKRDAALFEPLLNALVKAKKLGKTRFIGLSTHQNEPEVIDAAIESKLYDVVLTAYNFRQDHHLEVKKAIARAAQAGLGVVAMKTQAGVYWDKEKQFPINMKAALKWVLHDPNVHTAIPGFTAFDQMAEDLSVMENLEFTEQEKADLVPPATKLSGLYCQQCRQCLPQCPANLPIPDLMRAHMYARAYKNYGESQDLIRSLQLSTSPCGSCSTCSVRCTKNIDIRRGIHEIAAIGRIDPTLFA